MPTSRDVLDAIGNTPLVELRRVVPPGSARVVMKLESANPTGSMKDRVARAMIDAAAASGRLPPGGTVVEYTSGTTGVSLAFVCAARGYRSHFVYSDAFSEEKRLTMLAYGAELTDVPSGGKGITGDLVKAMIAKAAELGRRPAHWSCDQLNNQDGEAGYHALGDELWEQSDGRVDVFVQAVGTAHAIHGTARALRRHQPALRVVAVEPAESAVLSGKPSGSHEIEGIGVGFVPPLWRRDQVDEILPVGTGEAKAMARRLARDDGIFAGTSSGANVVAALRVAARLGAGATVATIAVDSGLRYLSTDVFRARPREHGLTMTGGQGQSIGIGEERPDSPDAMQLIAELDAHLGARYAVESRHGFSVEKLLRDGVAFFVVRVDGHPAGCGGVKLFGTEYAEVKRMYVRPAYRGLGLGKRVLDHLTEYARARQVGVLRLETGIYQTEAIALYERYGFRRRPPFGEYREDPVSLCYEMPISGSR